MGFEIPRSHERWETLFMTNHTHTKIGIEIGFLVSGGQKLAALVSRRMVSMMIRNLLLRTYEYTHVIIAWKQIMLLVH